MLSIVDKSNILIQIVLSCSMSGIIGYPFSKFLETNTSWRILLSVPIGMGVFLSISGLLLNFFSFSSGIIILIYTLIVFFSYFFHKTKHFDNFSDGYFSTDKSYDALILFYLVLVALLPVFTIYPQITKEGVGFGGPLFDHVKMVIIDEIKNNGLPLKNPFFQMEGSSPYLNYYYMFYVLGAEFSLLVNSTSYESEIAMTYLASFSSLTLVCWLSAAYSEDPNAPKWALISVTISSLIPALTFIIGPFIQNFIVPEHGLETWLILASWVPQHLLSATFSMLALLGFQQLINRDNPAIISAIIIGCLISSAYGCSAWIGGILLPIMLICVFLHFIITRRAENLNFKSLGYNIGVSGLISVIFCSHLLFNQIQLLGKRKILSFWLFPVLNVAKQPEYYFVDILAFWFILLIIDFGAIYIACWIWIISNKNSFVLKKQKLFNSIIIISWIVPLFLAEILHSVLLNNDFGWRVVIVSVLTMTVVFSVVISRFTSYNQGSRYKAPLNFLIAFLLLGMIGGGNFLSNNSLNYYYNKSYIRDGAQLGIIHSMWEQVKLLTPKDEAVLNNPLSLRSLTPWPANLGWALFSGRRSCISGREWLHAYASEIPLSVSDSIIDGIEKLFNGNPKEYDVKSLKYKFHCKTIVVTPSDSLWTSDIIEQSGEYKLLNFEEGKWKIYR